MLICAAFASIWDQRCLMSTALVVGRVVLLDCLKNHLVIEVLITWMLCCLISKVVVWKGCFAGAREGVGKFARTNSLNTWGNILPAQGLFMCG